MLRKRLLIGMKREHQTNMKTENVPLQAGAAHLGVSVRVGASDNHNGRPQG